MSLASFWKRNRTTQAHAAKPAHEKEDSSEKVWKRSELQGRTRLHKPRCPHCGYPLVTRTHPGLPEYKPRKVCLAHCIKLMHAVLIAWDE